MIKTTATQLKMKLGQFMRAVRSGKEVVITDRKEPVARLVPYRTANNDDKSAEVFQARDPAAPYLGEISVRGIQNHGINTLEMLREDRDRK